VHNHHHIEDKNHHIENKTTIKTLKKRVLNFFSENIRRCIWYNKRKRVLNIF